MDDQTALGMAIAHYRQLHPDATAVEAAEWTKTAEGQLVIATALASNGVRKTVDEAKAVVGRLIGVRPAEPTHALPDPPDLVDGPLSANDLGALFIGPGPTQRKIHPCKICAAPLQVTPRLRYVCMNEECERYEEVL